MLTQWKMCFQCRIFYFKLISRFYFFEFCYSEPIVPILEKGIRVPL